MLSYILSLALALNCIVLNAAPVQAPVFAVASIRDSDPARVDKAFTVHPEEFIALNVSLAELMVFAYGIQQKQIVDAPEWVRVKHFDVKARPESGERLDEDRSRAMLKALLTERFHLSVSESTQDMAAYVLTADGNNVVHLHKSTAGIDTPMTFTFARLGDLTVKDASMSAFAGALQASVFDRPIVDETHLSGKWDFTLKWTPAEGEFSALGLRIAPAVLKPDDPPSFFTAIREQLGLRLQPKRARVAVFSIVNASFPSPN